MITQRIFKHLIDNKLTTKVQLQKELLVTPYTITNLLNGHNELNVNKLLYICKIYNLDINNFYE